MPRGENRPSILLTKEENDQVFSLIAPKCQSLATAVVQLFTTEGPGHSEWKKKDTGVLCLIKDNAKRSYFFRIYCLYRKTMIWEHEVYLQIEYKSPRPYLHTFEAEEYMTAFNFANEDEARVLRNILIEKIELRKCRREERRQRSMAAARTNSGEVQLRRQNGMAAPTPPAPHPLPIPEKTPTPLPPPPKAALLHNTNTLKSGKKRKRILRKEDIGSPQNFQHISHVGWDAQKGFDVETSQPNEELLSFFSMAGVSEKQLQDEETREFIYSFIETHGGIDAVKEDLHTSHSKPVRSGSSRGARVSYSPPPPYSTLPPPAPAAPSPPAPPVPARSPAPAYPPAPPSRAPPPPPPAPPSRGTPLPPPPPPTSLAHRNPPPPRPLQPPTSAPPSVPPPPPPGVPPPPPPPPPPAAPSPPAAPPPPAPGPPDAAVPMDARAALMESIRSGSKALKRVEVNKPASEDSRSNLLSEIRQGIELKSVSRSESGAGAGYGAGRTAAASAAAVPACGLAGALARALQERSRAIQDSDDDDDEETTSDGEWDE